MQVDHAGRAVYYTVHRVVGNVTQARLRSIAFDEVNQSPSLIRRMCDALGLHPSDFGIACPYSGQRRQLRNALVKARFREIPVGTTEYWQGKEAKLMIVDFVRARNDNGSLGFLVKKERLNVLLTRQ